MLIAYRARKRAVFLVGFAKSERENVTQDELLFLRRLAENWLTADGTRIQNEMEIGNLQEIEDGEEA